MCQWGAQESSEVFDGVGVRIFCEEGRDSACFEWAASRGYKAGCICGADEGCDWVSDDGLLSEEI